MRPHTHKTEAIVLKGAPRGEADRLLTLLTPDLGKVMALARGVRRPSSRLGGHLEPLTHARVMLARGRAPSGPARWVVAGAEALSTFPGLRSELERLAQALALAEAVDALSPLDQPSRGIFTLLRETVERLATGEGDKALLYGQANLLALAGFRPELYRCVECATPVLPDLHLFAPAIGGVVCPACVQKVAPPVLPISLNALKVSRYLLSQPYERVRPLRLSPALTAEVGALLRDALRHVAERDLKAAAFLERLHRQGKG